LSTDTLTLIKVLKAGFLLLLYLFLYRAVRAVYVEVSPRRALTAAHPRGRAVAGAPRSRRVKELCIVAPPEVAGKAWPLEGELVIGRGAGCAVHLDDSFASQSHARLFPRDGRWYVEDLGSTNGTFLNRDRVGSATPMRKGDRMRVGETVLELRG
jgi:FHA domain-containing protein